MPPMMLQISTPRKVFIEAEPEVDDGTVDQRASRRKSRDGDPNVPVRVIDPSATPRHKRGDSVVSFTPAPQQHELDLEKDLIALLSARQLDHVPVFHDKDGMTLQVTMTVELRLAQALIADVLALGIGDRFGCVNLFPVDFSRPLHKRQKRSERFSEGEIQRIAASGLLLDRLVQSTQASATISFDFVWFLLIAAVIAAIGLFYDNSVVIVASMLISPMMCPIIAAVIGTIVRNRRLFVVGLKTSLLALVLCVVVGALAGTVMLFSEEKEKLGVPLGSAITSTGDPKGIVIGVALAIVSGFAVSLGLLQQNASSMVGVAMSTSLLPPAVNAGMIFTFAWVFNEEDETGHKAKRAEMLRIALYSLVLCLVNIALIYACALFMFWLKKVAPIPKHHRLFEIDFAQLQTAREELAKELPDSDASADWLEPESVSDAPPTSLYAFPTITNMPHDLEWATSAQPASHKSSPTRTVCGVRSPPRFTSFTIPRLASPERLARGTSGLHLNLPFMATTAKQAGPEETSLMQPMELDNKSPPPLLQFSSSPRPIEAVICSPRPFSPSGVHTPDWQHSKAGSMICTESRSPGASYGRIPCAALPVASPTYCQSSVAY